MKPVPLLLILSSVLLSSHLRPAAGRPHVPPGLLDDSDRLKAQLLDDVLLRAAAAAGEGAALDDNILRYLHRSNPEYAHLLPAEEESDDEVAWTAAQLLKRSEDPALSLDLTFHLLRNMIHVANLERQLVINREKFNEAGK